MSIGVRYVENCNDKHNLLSAGEVSKKYILVIYFTTCLLHTNGQENDNFVVNIKLRYTKKKILTKNKKNLCKYLTKEKASS